MLNQRELRAELRSFAQAGTIHVGTIRGEAHLQVKATWVLLIAPLRYLRGALTWLCALACLLTLTADDCRCAEGRLPEAPVRVAYHGRMV